MTSELLVPVNMEGLKKGNKYEPHQGNKERRRRMKQIERGTLKGPEEFIPVEVRYRAAGLYEGGALGTIVVKR